MQHFVCAIVLNLLPTHHSKSLLAFVSNSAKLPGASAHTSEARIRIAVKTKWDNIIVGEYKIQTWRSPKMAHTVTSWKNIVYWYPRRQRKRLASHTIQYVYVSKEVADDIHHQSDFDLTDDRFGAIPYVLP